MNCVSLSEAATLVLWNFDCVTEGSVKAKIGADIQLLRNLVQAF